MVTRKTRWMSWLVTVLMLVSLFTAFVLPVSAAGQTDLKADKGLADYTSLPNIADGIKSGVKDYQINSRAGFDKMQEIWDVGNHEVHIYQTADIDMGWIPFAGISGEPNNKSWESSTQLFDGNGFVIKNLFINAPDRTQVALFNRCWANTTIKNVGIASGLIIGWNTVGSIAGVNCGGNIINCWSAATIVTGTGSANQGTGGLVGQFWSRYGNSADMVNSYFIGTIISQGRYASGLIGRYAEDSTASAPRVFANNYFAGTMASAFTNTDMFAAETTDVTLPGYHVLFRGAADGQRADNAYTLKGGTPVAGGTTANNYYRENGSGLKSYADAVAAGVKLNGKATLDIDGASAVTEAQVGDGSLTAKLNSGNLELGAVEGYTLGYVQTADGYPALGYYKDGDLVICRTADAGHVNVNAEDLAARGTLFGKIVEARNGGLTTPWEEVTVSSANDLFALGVLMFQSEKTSLRAATVKLGADIDCAAVNVVPGCPWMFPVMSTTMNSVLDGQNHVIYNWKAQGNVYANQPTVGLIQKTDGGTVKNLGMIDAYGEIAFGYKSGDIWIYPALIIGQVTGANTTTVENCFVTGHIEITKDGSFIGAGSSNNAGAVVGRTMGAENSVADGPQVAMKNCWSDVDRTFSWNGETAEFRTLGSTKAAYGTFGSATLENVCYIAEETLIGSSDNTTDDYEIQPNVDKDLADGSMAAYLNNTIEGACYTVKNGNTVFGTADNATRTLTVKKLMENGTLIDSYECYYNAGALVEIPVIDGYELDVDGLPDTASQTTFDMPKENLTLKYYVTGIDFSGVEEINKTLSEYDFDLFNESETMEQMQELVDATLAYKDQEQTPEMIAAANAAITNTIHAYNALNIGSLTLKDAYPNVPPMGKYNLYKGYNPKNWGISTKEDWIGATAITGDPMEGITIHLLNDVDMDNTNVQPLTWTTGFSGTLDGHGFVFENFNMTQTLTTNEVGLVRNLNATGVIKNLGIASGAFNITYNTSADIGVGVFAGSAAGGSKFINCWNAASLTVTTAPGALNTYAAGGIVGRGYNGSVVDGCYNVGTITGTAHVAGINDWAQDTGAIYNSFNAGELKASLVGLIRHNSNSATNPHSNSYSLGYQFASSGHADRTKVLNAEPWTQMDTSIYSDGRLAWMLNSGYATGTKTYYTVKDGKTVFGTADNQTVRVSLVCSGSATEYVYVNAGESVTLNYADNAEYALAAGAAGSLNGAVYTAGNEDATVNVTIVGFNYKNLDDAFAYYAERDTALYADFEEMNLAELIETLKARKESNSFSAQGEIDAFAGVLMSFELINEYPNLPAASDAALYPEAVGFLIKNVADLEFASENVTLFTADQTLYLDADLDLTGSSFKGFLKLYADFDGKSHSISNLAQNTAAEAGFFRYFYGEKISNLTLDNVHFIGGYGRAVLVAELYSNGGLTIENVHIKDSSVTATGSGQNAMGVLLSRTNPSGGAVNIKNCTVTGTAMYSAESYSGDLGNAGIIVGQMHNGRIFNITNVVVSDCHVAFRATFASGIGFGCAEGAANVKMNNVAILNNRRTNSVVDWSTRGVLIGTVKGGSLLDLDNVILLNNQQKKADQYEIKNDTGEWNPAINMTTSDTVAMEGYSATNCFTDWGSFHNNNNQNNDNGSKTNVTPADYGYIAHAINATGVTMKWEVTAAGTLAVDEDGAGLPYAITFFAFDEDEATEDIELVLYTNAEGKLIGLTQDLLNMAVWEEEETLADKVFTSDSVVVGTIPTAHECVWGEPTHIDGTDTHMVECTVDGCEETKTLDCVFEEVETVDANAAPDAAAHIIKCACGNATEPVLCSADAEKWTYTKVDAKCEVAGSIDAACATCGYTYHEDLDALEHAYGEYVHVEGTQTHAAVCANECGIDDVRDCTFSGEWVEEVAPQIGVPGLAKRPCDENCGNFETKTLDPLPEPPVVEDPVFGIEMPEKAAPGEEITVEIFLAHNPGVAGVMVDVAYDVDALELTAVTAGELGGTVEYETNETGARLGVINAYNVTEDGTLFVLTFTVADEADGLYLIDLTPVESNVVDENGAPVAIGVAGGSVAVSSAIVGDVSGDGRVSIADAVLLLRIASGDTNLPAGTDLVAGNISSEGDTPEMPINTADVVLMLQYLSGSVTEL